MINYYKLIIWKDIEILIKLTINYIDILIIKLFDKPAESKTFNFALLKIMILNLFPSSLNKKYNLLKLPNKNVHYILYNINYIVMIKNVENE